MEPVRIALPNWGKTPPKVALIENVYKQKRIPRECTCLHTVVGVVWARKHLGKRNNNLRLHTPCSPRQACLEFAFIFFPFGFLQVFEYTNQLPSTIWAQGDRDPPLFLVVNVISIIPLSEDFRQIRARGFNAAPRPKKPALARSTGTGEAKPRGQLGRGFGISGDLGCSFAVCLSVQGAS